MSELMSLIDSYTTADVHHLAEPALLVETEMLIEAQNRLGAAVALHLQAMDVRDVTVNECGRQPKSWLIEEQHLSPKDAGRRMWVARRLPAHPAVADALVAGDITHDHAQIIIRCLASLSAEHREATETELLTFAREHDPGLLAQLCQQVRVITGADEDAEAAAQRKYDDRWVTIAPTYTGMVSISGMLDPESGATVQAALTPLSVQNPGGDPRTSGQRTADALTDLARFSLSHGDLPDHSGERPQVILTIPLAELRDRLEAGQLSAATINGQPITPSAARRIACDANLIPAVLGGPSEILDLGRSRRIFSRAQHRAAALRDGGCAWPQCQTPLSRSELHHSEYWENGGRTDHHLSAYVCTFHHWLIHHTPWTLTRNAQGKIEVRRT
jgi:Domain of unknown function (DUF222)